MEIIQLHDNEASVKMETNINTSPEPPLKHPLEHKWTLWFYESNKNKSWLENLHDVYSFDTVEDFWCLYNHIRPVNELVHGNDYMLFKHGIQPMWEDEANKRGGRWIANVDSKQNSPLNDLWLNVLLFMIGESFDEYSDEICGAFINIRKMNRISLWTSDASKQNDIMAIGEKFKYECLRFNREQKITYETHDDYQKKSSSKAIYTLFC